MKRILAASVLSITCFSAHAALLNRPPEQLVPWFNGGAEIGLSGGWFRPAYHDIGLVVVDTSGNINLPSGKAVDLDECYAFSSGAYLGWKFAQTGNDLRLLYFQSYTSNTTEVSKKRPGQFLYTVGSPEPSNFISIARDATGKLEFNLNRWDLEFAQHMDFCLRTNMRFFLGVSNHHIKKKVNIRYVGDPITDLGKRQINISDSDFNGTGPRIGLDFQYAMNYGFGIVSSVSSSLLYGSVTSETNIRSTGGSSGPTGTRISLDRTLVVPNIDLKVGLDYSYCFTNGHVGDVEIGWWINSYVNAVNDTEYVSGTIQSAHDDKLSSVTFNGFYLTGSYSM